MLKLICLKIQNLYLQKTLHKKVFVWKGLNKKNMKKSANKKGILKNYQNFLIDLAQHKNR